MDALTALRTKRDTRSYTADTVDDEIMIRVLDAARMAGSAKNRQPVRLLVVTDHEDKVAIKEGGDFAAWIDGAPAVVVAAVETGGSVRVQFDVGRHLQNLMVAAHAEGLATCPVTVHRPEVVAEVLGVPETHEVIMFVTLGWPAPGGEAPPQIAGPRVGLEEYATFGHWPVA